MKPVYSYLLVAALALSACATENQGRHETTGPTPETAAPALEQAATPAATPPPMRIFPPPAMLDGLEAVRVLDLLGQPPFKRRDDPALIWQYRTSQCALDLFLYRDKAGGAYRVRHFETRNRGTTAVSQKDCFAALINANEKGTSG